MAAFTSVALSTHITRGLAKIFDLEILTHGTTFTNCYGILKNGADPSKGGSEIGSTYAYVGGNKEADFTTNTHNVFYVFKDSTAKKGCGIKNTHYNFDEKIEIITYSDLDGNTYDKQQFKKLSFKDMLELHFAPRFHSYLAATSRIDEEKNTSKKITIMINEFLIFYFPQR